MLVLQLPDQRELLSDHGADLLRHALRPAHFQSCFGHIAQVLRGVQALRNQLLRIAIAQRGQRELAAFRDAQRFLEQLARIDLRQLLAGTQMTLAVGMQRWPAAARVQRWRMAVSVS